MEYFASAVNVVSSYSFVGPLSRINIYFALLSICTDELISAPKITTFFPMLSSDNENSERESSPIPYPLYLNLSGSVFLVSFTAPNKQSFRVKSVSKSRDHMPNS